MRPEQRDASYLWDMLEAARTVLEVTQGVTLSEYSENRILHLAVERAIQIIGEAANRVSAEFQAAHPEIPWRQIVDQRNVLVHEYGDVEHALIWELVQRHIPILVSQLASLMPPPPQELEDA
ncbi:MAG TPA: HepT-like ribonuclease domain-containing protein [Thermoanaerobaculia bacterium]